MKTTTSGCWGLLLFILIVLIMNIRDSTQSFCGVHDSYQEYAWDGSNSTTQPNDIGLFQSNLYSVFFALPSQEWIGNWSFSSFYSGEEPNAAYATALCIGGVSYDTCLSCVKDATYLIKTDCANKTKAAIIWYKDCLVRYSNHRIHGIVSMPDEMIHIWNDTANVASSDADAFDRSRTKLFNALTDQTSISDRFFAAGKRYVASSNMTIFGAAQCTADLYNYQCSDCLAIVGRKVGEYFHGKKGGKVVGPSCNFRYEIYPFVNESAWLIYDLSSPSPPPPPQPLAPESPLPPAKQSPPSSPVSPPSPPSSVGKGTNNSLRVIYIVVPLVIFCVVLFVGLYVCLRKKKHKKPSEDVEIVGKSSDEDEISIYEPDHMKTEETLQYAFSTISAATKNFSEANKLGQGGFGVVYKGKLQNGCEIAVKRLSMTSIQGEVEFKNEVTLMAKLQHRNLVRLLGFCLKRKERLLIYEFVANSSLDKFIFDPIKRAHLNWDRFYKIIGGVARGLLYLHEDSRLRIVHRDLKSSNILLDDEMTPKIADFGMARLFVTDETHGRTSRIVGTYGYMAPEYAMHGEFSNKSDVFSFGVLLLEIIHGRRNSYFRIENSVEDLLSYAWKCWQEGTILNLIDPALRLETSSAHEMTRCIHIGLVCAQEDVTRRPTMASVVNMLSNLSIDLPVPSKPPFSQQRIVNQDQFWNMIGNSEGSNGKSGSVWSADTELLPR